MLNKIETKTRNEKINRRKSEPKKIMKKHSVIVNDIYEQSIPIHQKFGKGPDNVHYSNQGYEKLSELVTKFLKTEIESMKSK